MDNPLAQDVALAVLSDIFRPSAPTDDRQLFRGRQDELAAATQAMQSQGQHAIIFGERGVGKTSLSYMLLAVFKAHNPTGLAIRIACGASDTFASTWAKLPARLQKELDLCDSEIQGLFSPFLDRVEDMFLDDPTPESVNRALHLLSSVAPVLIVIDEFDRMDGFAHSAAFADLVKQLSDDLIPATVCFVGVSDDVSGLIAGHASIDRALRAVPMPRMTHSELAEIVTKGFAEFEKRSQLKLHPSKEAVDAIANLSQGFPYYTHLLAKSVGQEAIYENRTSIEFSHVFDALVRAKNEAEPSIKESFYRATVASRADATYKQTMIACALAKLDHGGYFTASNVRGPLEDILRSPRKNSDFNAHLKRFSEDDPIIFDCDDRKRTRRYRFCNPLMKPYVLMVGFESKILDSASLGIVAGSDIGD